MLKLPVVNKGVTLQEIPGEISVFFELGNCKQKCKGCHSPMLQIPLGKVHWTDIEEMAHYAETEKSRGATAIVLMGGTTNGITFIDLMKTIKRLSKVLPVGIYSGAAVSSITTLSLKAIRSLTWLKAGEYREELGGLNSMTTNQRFYKRISEDEWSDITAVFPKD
ncbi:radical SAM family protein [Propionispora hippei]|uniref:Anaerobic ribonucleoside-triphosphate reductase activating protein n=1 Tax=Propionispora hippei DSM 15287 TaxID=1123003 RepID=A0A1M6MEZ2_9FIRM|nr:4Fe-4S cluster-binding domain-containing protein [Propionispora hippei]SHJ82082.1 anaerobic ribonucleoside-triphosphate reductase activating protein [Propionispora hippei DSM 15287]